MYLEFFRLRQKPFTLAPDPRFMFMSTSHREALAHLLYGIQEGHGFIQVVGQVGTGKTTLCRTLLDQVGYDAEVAFIFNPSPSEIELLQAIHREFGLATGASTRTDLVAELNRFLLQKKAEGRRVLLVIDEAQNLEPDVLEQIRLLSNLETDSAKLIQIVLIGQPELDDALARSDLRQLRQRITVRWRLQPFGRREVAQYVEHRMSVAGHPNSGIFTRGALRALHRRSRGIPRLINSIADRALLGAYSRGRRRVNAREIRGAARELPGALRDGWLGALGLRWSTAALLLAAGIAAGTLAGALLGKPPSAPVVAEAAGDPPAVSAVQLGSALEPRLRALGAEASASLALDTLLDYWGYPQEIPAAPAPSAYPEIVRSISRLNVFATESLLERVLLLDLPAVLELELAPGELRYAALVGADGAGNVDLALGREHFVLAPADLERLWTRRIVYLWNNYKSLPALEPGMTGSAVRWAQARLAELGFLAPGDPSGEYDMLTIDAVRSFQQARALEVTGSVDSPTLIALYQALDYDTPRLSGLASGGES
jgi:general secretion pathway protein A